MHKPITTWHDFKQHWGGLYNFFMAGEVTPFKYEMPPLERIIEEVRHDAGAVFRSGVKQAEFDLTDIREEFLKLPIREAMRRKFVLAHFSLTPQLTGPGKVFAGLEEQWVEPWRQALAAQGFTWDKVFPILFASGPHSASNYHMDVSHQLAWQWYGMKHFCSLKDPDRWTTRELRGKCSLKGSVKPAGITEADTLTHVQPPGAVLWNAITTPHWVETFDEPAATLTIAHFGLKLNGERCPHQVEIDEYRAEQAKLGEVAAKATSY